MIQQERKKFIQSTDILKLRVIDIPNYIDFKYYTEQNLLMRLDDIGAIYSINDNLIEYNEKQSNQFINSIPGKIEQLVCLQNCIIAICQDHFVRFNIQNLNEYKLVQRIPNIKIEKYAQVNNKCFITNRNVDNKIQIHQLKNLKISHSLICKFRITSAQYHKQIVQAFTRKCLYYYNINMTKKIRKYQMKIIMYDEPLFNSNYLLIPQIIDQYLQLDTYDICSMKIIKTIVTQNTSLPAYKSAIYISDYNIIAILYCYKLELYNFNSLQLISNENTDHDWWDMCIMRYDKSNGIMIFL